MTSFVTRSTLEERRGLTAVLALFRQDSWSFRHLSWKLVSPSILGISFKVCFGIFLTQARSTSCRQRDAVVRRTRFREMRTRTRAAVEPLFFDLGIVGAKQRVYPLHSCGFQPERDALFKHFYWEQSLSENSCSIHYRRRSAITENKWNNLKFEHRTL